MIIEIVSNKVYRARSVASLKQNSKLLLRPLAFALLMLRIWKALRSHGVYFDKSSEVPMTTVIVAGIMLLFAIPAGFVLQSVYEEFKKIVISVIEYDRHTYLLYRDERVPVPIHLLLGTFAMAAISGVMFVNYEHEWSGIFGVFTISFLLALYFVVVTELDDPRRCMWLRLNVDPDWDKVDVMAYRKKLIETKKKAHSEAPDFIIV